MDEAQQHRKALQSWLDKNPQPVAIREPYYCAEDGCSASRTFFVELLMGAGAVQARESWSRAESVSCLLHLFCSSPPDSLPELRRITEGIQPWFASSQFTQELLRQLDENKRGYWWHTIDLLLWVFSPSSSSSSSSSRLDQVVETLGLFHKLTALVVELVRHYLTPLKLAGLRLTEQLCSLVPLDCRQLLLDVLTTCLTFNEHPLIPACFSALDAVYPTVEQTAGEGTRRLLNTLHQSLTRSQEISLRRLYLEGATSLIDRHLRLRCLLVLRSLILAALEYLKWGDERLVAAGLRLLLALMTRCWPRMPAHSPGVFLALTTLLFQDPSSALYCRFGPEANALLCRSFACLRAIDGARFDEFVAALPESGRDRVHACLSTAETQAPTDSIPLSTSTSASSSNNED